MKFDTAEEAIEAAKELGSEIANDGRDISAIERWLESYTFWPDIVATITREVAIVQAKFGFITQTHINDEEREREA
jgi:hypothetical protein